MSGDKQMINDLIEIFDEEYGKRNLITPQNTAEKMTAKGYRKSTDLAEEIFAEIEDTLENKVSDNIKDKNPDWWLVLHIIAELKKKYTSVTDSKGDTE